MCKTTTLVLLTLAGTLIFAHMAITGPVDMNMQFKDNSHAEDLTKFIIDVKRLGSFLSQQEGKTKPSDCELCKLLFTAIKIVVDSNMTNDEAIMFAATICTSSGVQSEEICYYGMKNFVPDIRAAYSIAEANVSVSNGCGFLVGGSCVIEDEFLPVFDWNVTFPTPEPPYIPPPQPNPTSPKIRILHMSDTHIDDQYLEGSVENCNEPMCCRANKMAPPPNEPSYAGKYGGVNATCDIPKITLESMLDYASNNLQFDFVYWTGDIPPHDVWNQTKDGNIRMIQETSALVRNYFSTDDTVFSSVGNHEPEPCNGFPVPAVYDDYSIGYLYTQLDDVWSTFIPNLNHSTVLKGGYYAFDVRPGLRVISLNTNLGHGSNWWLLVDSEDPTEQFQWLIQQLDDAERNNIKVHIIGHIPPGRSSWVYSRNYRDILNRYKGTITGHFYGHTHNDEFEMIYDDVNTSYPTSVAHIGPSITTSNRLNPSFRIYIIDGDYPGTTWQVLDYEAYWLNVSRANADGFPTWELLYTAKAAYGMADFTAASFNNLIERMEVDDSLFQKFYQQTLRVFTNPACEGSCKAEILCQLRKGWAGYNATSCGSELAQMLL